MKARLEGGACSPTGFGGLFLKSTPLLGRSRGGPSDVLCRVSFECGKHGAPMVELVMSP